MKRVLLTVALLVVVPALSAAQTPPPPPVPPPAMPAPPAPPRSPTPVVVPRAITAVEPTWVIQDALRAASIVDVQTVRDAVESARLAVDQVRVLTPDFHPPMPAMRFEFDHLLDFQPRFGFDQDSNGSYGSGLSAISQKQWERAITSFDRAIAQKSARSDGALYWKAYAQYRNNQVPDALTTIAALRRDYAQSKYITDARILETDVKRTPPQEIVDDDLKLLAIAAQQHQSDQDRAIGLLEGVLTSTNSLRVKQRALFVLAQFAQPRARQVLLSYAKGAGLPDLQATAIQYLAQDKKTSAEELRSIYESTTDERIKLAIISAYQSTGNRNGLMTVVSAPGTPMAVRQQAMGGLTGILSPQDLWQLYEKEQDAALRRQIVGAFGSMRAVDQLMQVLKVEKDPAVRRRAISSLGSLKVEQTGPMLVELYGRETDLETKRAIISSLSSQNNAESLVAIAKKETSLELKRDLVAKLSEMSRTSKVAADYMMEILRSPGK